VADYSLKAVFGLDATGVKTELKSLTADVREFANKWGQIAFGAGVAAFVALSKGAIDLAGNLSDTARNLGVNVESLQALEAQHKRNGVSEEQLVKALEKTKKAVIDAAEGDKTASDALQLLGLRASELIRLPLAEQYAAIGKAAKNSTDQAAAYSAVTAILGEKVGPKLMESLRELGETGLPKVTEEARKAGQVMSAETIVALDKAGDAIDDFKKRAVVAIGNIIVNFRTEEGLKLLWLQLSDVVLRFAAGMVDAITYPSRLAFNVMWAALGGVVDLFRNGMVEAIKFVAEQVNKVLPDKWQINIAGIESLKVAAVDVSDRITRAIADTNPSALRDTLGEATKAMVSEQQKVVDSINKIDLGKEAKKLTDAGKAIVIKPPVIPPLQPSPALEVLINSFTGAVSSLTRVGKGYEDQSTASLQGVAANLQRQLSQTDSTGRQIKDATINGNYGSYLTAQTIRQELDRINAELTLRSRVQGVVQAFGENAARSQFGDTVTDRALRDMQTSSTRTAIATEAINNNLAAVGRKLGITPID
jgi:hypothetical protein